MRVPCPAAMMMALVNGLAAEAAGVTADFISASSFGRKEVLLSLGHPRTHIVAREPWERAP
jgi:hypothetical protein